MIAMPSAPLPAPRQPPRRATPGLRPTAMWPQGPTHLALLMMLALSRAWGPPAAACGCPAASHGPTPVIAAAREVVLHSQSADRTPPQLTCPAELAMPAGASPSMVLAAVEGQDAAGPIDLFTDAPAALQGRESVTVTAVDTAGHATSCVIAVYVTGPTLCGAGALPGLWLALLVGRRISRRSVRHDPDSAR